VIDLLALWLALLVVLAGLATGRQREGGALTLSYFVGLSLIHVPGALIFAGGDSASIESDVTRVGFELTVIGMSALVAGAVLARLTDPRGVAVRLRSVGGDAQPFGHLGGKLAALGVVAYFVLLPLSAKLPSATAIVSAMATVLILGLWLALYSAAIADNQRRTAVTLALLPSLPLSTLVTGGFLGYGVYWILSVIAFLFVIVKNRTLFYLLAPVVAYLGLSLFVTYAGQRGDIRELVWYENSSLLIRLERISHLVTDFEFLDLDRPSHASAIDARLNQNRLVGAAVAYHESGAADFAYGGTVPVWALIPRVIWPDKPEVGGSGNIVSDYTGIQFARGTSVGVGQVLEFYVNFGIPGILAGFAFLGFVLMRLDRGTMRALAEQDTLGFLVRAMPGLTLLQPGGSLLEIIVALVAARVAAQLILSANLLRLSRSARRQRSAAA
jgi:hypothetical protein